jgi:hypothetical protein
VASRDRDDLESVAECALVLLQLLIAHEAEL